MRNMIISERTNFGQYWKKDTTIPDGELKFEEHAAMGKINSIHTVLIYQS